MCYYEKTHFDACGHDTFRLMQHCHFARNDPGHQCFGAWNVKREHLQSRVECKDCTARRAALKTNGVISNSVHVIQTAR
ncbi:hypothetical protein K491DRAFT_587967 [Lophiostoma macrostomum CBS 122681]|uniref:Uncharacterized protein n=1 Tax=Lophiostoma macrostomum CBS 122681 TaxID=1314788 RepID=A0A6A6TLZ1_9PLEO|nr:hypothetical protein K491DRAFT_587967 [Lophiostoma macrostomum CBS 122681]